MFSHFGKEKQRMISAESALKGRSEALQIATVHMCLNNPMLPPYPQGFGSFRAGMGCFWGAERRFWQQPGVFTTVAGYAGGYTENPTYQEVCSGSTGHTEVVQVVFDPSATSLEQLLQVFWESHDPTQGMRQGNDVGTQYRSALFFDDSQSLLVAEKSAAAYQQALLAAGKGQITTQVELLPTWYPAEDYHQQYLHKNPAGYCGLRGTGVACVLS